MPGLVSPPTLFYFFKIDITILASLSFCKMFASAYVYQQEFLLGF